MLGSTFEPFLCSCRQKNVSYLLNSEGKAPISVVVGAWKARQNPVWGFWGSMVPAPFQLRNTHGNWRVSEKNPAMGFAAEFKCWRTAKPSLLPDAGRGAEKHSLLLYPFPLFQWGSASLKSSFSRDISVLPLACHTETMESWGGRDYCELKGLTLPVKLFADPFTPLLAQIPDPAGIANVSTLECNLKARRKAVLRKKVTV